MVYITEKCDLIKVLSFLRFFFFGVFINILTGTLDGSLSVFALFVQIRLVNMHDVHHLMKAVLKLHNNESTILPLIHHTYFDRFMVICHLNNRVSFSFQ